MTELARPKAPRRKEESNKSGNKGTYQNETENVAHNNHLSISFSKGNDSL